MPFLVLTKTPAPGVIAEVYADPPTNEQPRIRTVTLNAAQRSCLCVFQKSDGHTQSLWDSLLPEIASNFGVQAADIEAVEVSGSDWDSVEGQVYDAIRAMKQAQRDANVQAARDVVAAQIMPRNQTGATDLVLVVPPPGQERQRFLKGLALLLREAGPPEDPA